MFSLTHIYCSEKIAKKDNSLFLYGSIFPDIPATGVIDWNLLKDKSEDFSKYVFQNYPDLQEFSDGITTHEDPVGIDRFVHGGSGYAYKKGKDILKPIKDIFLGRNSIKKLAVGYIAQEQLLTAAHNFIEFAVEYYMFNRHTFLKDDLDRVLSDVVKKQNQIVKVFSEYFDLDSEKVLININQFHTWLDYDLSTLSKADKAMLSLVKSYRGVKVDLQSISIALKAAREQVKGDYESFLEETIRKCQKDYEQYLSE